MHGASLAQAELSGSDFDTRREADGSVTVERWMYDVSPPPLWRKNMRDQFPDFGGNVDDGDRSQGVNGYVMNTITPETERTCHHFWAFMRNHPLDSQMITTQLRQGDEGVFGEDEDMLAAQQAAIDANPGHEFYSLSIDAGGMWVRRILDQMLEAEGRGGFASPATARSGGRVVGCDSMTSAPTPGPTPS